MTEMEEIKYSTKDKDNGEDERKDGGDTLHKNDWKNFLKKIELRCEI